MEKNLNKIIAGIMMFFSIVVMVNIIYTSIQKIKSEENILVELEEETEETEFEKEDTKGKESKVKLKKILLPTDDDICHHFEFLNTFSFIKFTSYTDSQNKITLQGFDKFVYSPPEFVLELHFEFSITCVFCRTIM